MSATTSPFYQRRGGDPEDDEEEDLLAIDIHAITPIAKPCASKSSPSSSSSVLATPVALGRSNSPTSCDREEEDIPFEFVFEDDPRPTADSPPPSLVPASVLASKRLKPSPADLSLDNIILPSEDEDEEVAPSSPLAKSANENRRSFPARPAFQFDLEEDDDMPFTASPSPPPQSTSARPVWDSANFSKCSIVEMTPTSVARLPRLAHLVRDGRRDTWALPFRDETGRINRPLLMNARAVLSDYVACGHLAITKAIVAEVAKACELAWPGVPLPEFVKVESSSNHQDSEDSESASSEDEKSTSDLLRETHDMLAQPLPAPVKVTDVSSTLLSKLISRKQSLIKLQPAQLAYAQCMPLTSERAQLRFSLEQQAKQLYVAKLIQKAAIKKQVQAEYEKPAEAPLPSLPGSALLDSQDGQGVQDNDDDDEAADEDYFSEGSMSSSSDSDEESSLGDDPITLPEQPSNNDENNNNNNDEVAALTPDAVFSIDLPSSSVPSAAPSPKQENNQAYRAMLLAEERTAKRHRSKGEMVENEASEEEEEEGVGNYGSALLLQKDAEKDENEAEIRINEDDLKGIVDTYSDDEDQADITDLYRKQADDKDASELKRVQRDVENHTLLRRRRGDGTRLGRALDDPMSEEESDEEIEQAREERYRAAAQERAALAVAIGGEKALKEVDEEEEQRIQFMQAARAAKSRRQASQTSSQATRVSATTPNSASTAFVLNTQSWLLDEDSQVVASQSLARSTSLPDGGGMAEDSNHGLLKEYSQFGREYSQSASRPASRPARPFHSQDDSSTGFARESSQASATAISSRPPNRPSVRPSTGLTQVSKTFVYTQVEVEEDTKPAKSTSNTVSSSNSSRRVPLSSIPMSKSSSFFQAAKGPEKKLTLRAVSGS